MSRANKAQKSRNGYIRNGYIRNVVVYRNGNNADYETHILGVHALTPTAVVRKATSQ